MSEVWKAFETANPKNIVVLKFLPGPADSEDALERFDNEFRTLAETKHPNVAGLHSSGYTDNGKPYFAMEYVEGTPITEYCDSNRLSIRQRVELMAEVCDAVSSFHNRGVLHRDLKPGNILVMEKTGPDGKTALPVPKIIDFGIACFVGRESPMNTDKALESGFVGTPSYAAPEQFAGGSGHLRFSADVYALGVILYELLTGCLPISSQVITNKGKLCREEMARRMAQMVRPRAAVLWKRLATQYPDLPIQDPQLSVCVPARGRLSVAQQHDEETIVPAQTTTTALTRARDCPHPQDLIRMLQDDIELIADRALKGDADLRYPHPQSLADDLRHYLQRKPLDSKTRPSSKAYRLRQHMRRNWKQVTAGAVLLLCLAGGLAATLWQSGQKTIALRSAKQAIKGMEQATQENYRNLHRASMADYSSALKAFKEDEIAWRKGERAAGFAGKSRWHEGVALLCKSLEREPGNRYAALRLHETLRYGLPEKRDWPELVFQHTGPVRSAFYNQDGRRILTASEDKTARLWEAATGKPVGEPMRHEDEVSFAIFSPDGLRILTASGTTVRIWAALTGKALGEAIHHGNWVASAVFSPDGMRILTNCGSTMQVWEVATGKALSEPMAHNNQSVSAVFSLDGTRILTAKDYKVSVWEVATGKPAGEPMSHEDEINSAVFSPDGMHVLTASDDSTVRMWEAATGKPVGKPLRHEEAVNSAIFSPDGTRILTTSNDNAAQVWEAANWRPIGQPLRHEAWVHSAAFSPDGLRILTASGNTAQVWEAATGQTLGEPLHHENITSAIFNPDGTRILTAGDDGTAMMWEAATGKPVGEPLRHKGFINSAMFSMDSTRVITASEDGTGKIWEPTMGKLVGEPLRHEETVRSAVFSPKGNHVLTASSDKTARMWETATGKPMGEPLHHKEAVNSAVFSPDGNHILTAGDDGTGKIWETTTGKPVKEPLRHEKAVASAVFSPDGLRILTNSGSTMQVWEVATGKALGDPMPHGNWIESAVFSPNGTHVLTASKDGTGRIWEAATGKPVGEPLQHEDTVYSAVFNPNGTHVLTASADMTARVWEAATGKPVGEPLRHEDAVTSAVFSPDGTRILTTSNDNTAQVWEAATWRPMGEPLRHEAWVHSAVFSPDGTRILTTCEDDTARVWTIISESKILNGISTEVRRWAQAAAGLRYSEGGDLLSIPNNERLQILTSSDAAVSQPDPWQELAIWIGTARKQRASEMRSSFSLRQMAEQERDFNGCGTVASLESALRYDPTVPLAHLLLAAALENADAAKGAEERDPFLPQRTAFLRRYDLNRMPQGDAALWARAAQSLNEAPETALVGLGPNALPVRQEALHAAGKALQLQLQLNLPSALRKKVKH